MIEKISMTTRNYVNMISDDEDVPFETADTDSLVVTWMVYDPEYDRIPEDPPWESHDWTNDYDVDHYDYEYSPEHDEEFE
jgi:hypothetical protein